MNDVGDRLQKMKVSLEYDTAFHTKRWCDLIPAIKVKEGWWVRVVPPFGGALARFCVSKKGLRDSVSIYLDGYSLLGATEVPYWEVYPYDGDTFRCKMEDTKQLVKAIEKSLKQIEKNDARNKSGNKTGKKRNSQRKQRSNKRRTLGRKR